MKMMMQVQLMLCLTLLLVLIGESFATTDDLSDEAWAAYKKTFHKKYSDEAEDADRRKYWTSSVKRVKAWNAGKHSWKQAVNQFSDRGARDMVAHNAGGHGVGDGATHRPHHHGSHGSTHKPFVYAGFLAHHQGSSGHGVTLHYFGRHMLKKPVPNKAD